jgi:23S rRNA (uracil1939-C5)-methyltransferase
MQSETIAIKKVVNGGHGLGHLPSGQVVLVRHTLPGETVVARVAVSRKSHLFARLEKVLTSHPRRRPPPCPFVPRCGGCDFQHADYPTQLALKEALLAELLSQSGLPLPPPAAMLPSPAEFGYRQRLRLQVDGDGRLGFYAARSHTHIAIETCLLAEDGLNQVLAALARHPEAPPLLRQTREVELFRLPRDGKVVALFHLRRRPRPGDSRNAQCLCLEIAGLTGIYFQGEDWPLTGPVAGQPVRLEISYPDIAGSGRELSLAWEVGGFCQVNLGQNRRLIETVLALAGEVRGKRVLDLFCGMGNFAIPLALAGAAVQGYEGQGAAVRAATDNARRAGLSRARFTKKPVHQACAELAASGENFEIVVIDPPRAGIPDLAPLLAKICRGRLVAVSCDPATLGRDLASLVAQGFTVTAIHPLDMFPQTHHIETVVLLHRCRPTGRPTPEREE